MAFSFIAARTFEPKLDCRADRFEFLSWSEVSDSLNARRQGGISALALYPLLYPPATFFELV